MLMQEPLGVVTPTLDGPVLTILAQVDQAFTPGQLHRMLGQYSEAGVRKVLTRLTQQGIVHAERISHIYRYRLNQEHLAAGAIIELANQRGTLLQRLEERLGAWPVQPVYAALFGSAARGDMQVGSDIDLLLVRPDEAAREQWDDGVGHLSHAVSSWTGNDARVLEYSHRDLAVRALDDPVLASVANEGLTVAGPTMFLRRLLKSRGQASLAD